MELGDLVAQGGQSQVFALGQARVLKLFRRGYRRSEVEAEARNTALIHALGYPVPRVDKVVAHEARYGFVMERLVGPNFAELALRAADRTEALGREFADLQVRLARLSSNELDPIEDRIQEKVARAPLSQVARNHVHACLAACPRGNSVFHGDFHPGNIVSTAHGPYVVDWFGAGRAHASADVAQTCLLIATALLPDLPVQAREQLHAGRDRFGAAYLQQYFAHSGVVRSEVLLWMRPLAAARLHDEQGLKAPRSDRMLLEAIASGARQVIYVD